MLILYPIFQPLVNVVKQALRPYSDIDTIVALCYWLEYRVEGIFNENAYGLP